MVVAVLVAEDNSQQQAGSQKKKMVFTCLILLQNIKNLMIKIISRITSSACYYQ
jgi:hypothetical protein